MRGKILPVSISIVCGLAPLAPANGGNAQPQPARHVPSVVSGTCNGLKKMEYVTSNIYYEEMATLWEDLPNASVNFVSSKRGCVVVTFSGAAGTDADDAMFVQAVLDSGIYCDPWSGGVSYFVGYNAGVSGNSKTYICNNVPPGNHSLKAQSYTVNGNGVQLFGFTLTVSHH